MFIGACLFVLIFLLISPPSRAFLLASMTGTSAWIASWAPFSYILLAIAAVAPIVGIYIIKSWPVHVEPENPMAKYRREPVDEGD